jgi:predicted aconitase
MFHLEGVTPEARQVSRKGLPSISITRSDLDEARREYTDGTEAELIALGSPQLSSEELRDIARRVERSPPRIPVWIFTNRAVREANPEVVASVERHGGRVLADTCLEVTLLEHRFRTVATPSGKGAHYLPALCKQKVILDRIDALLERYT